MNSVGILSLILKKDLKLYLQMIIDTSHFWKSLVWPCIDGKYRIEQAERR